MTYRAADVVLPATGNLAADSGKSIFLEESFQQQGNVKTFRWEIPYMCIVSLNESPEIPSPSASPKAQYEAEQNPAPRKRSLAVQESPCLTLHSRVFLTSS